MFRTLLAAAALCATGTTQAGTLFMGAYPDAILVVDDASGAVTQRIRLASGLPTSLRLSTDKTRIYVSTITTSGIEVIDVATRKVINQFSLNTPTTRYRMGGGVPDPTGKFIYTVVTKIEKLADHYEVGKPQYAVIDLEKKAIVRTYDIDKEDENQRAGWWRTSMMVSQDGRFLYLFRDKVIVLDTETFKVVERIDLSKPEVAGFEGASFGPPLDRLDEQGRYVALFNASDPYIHNKMFGVGRFDLSTRAFTFTPIGPAPTAKAGLQVAPGGRTAYTVVTNGTLGNKRCEFWRFDMATNAVQDKAEFQCRSRFQFGMSGDGRKLYIYGASFDIEVYDAKTLKRDYTWDLGNDATGGGLIVTQ